MMNPTGMKTYHQRRYRGGNCCLSLAGHLQEDLIKQVLDSPLMELERCEDTLNR